MVSGSAIGTLIVFLLSIACVIRPFSIPVFGRKFPINLTTAPIIAILVLWAAQCLVAKNFRDGIVGTDGVKPYNILILFFSLAYMAITLDTTGILQAAAFWVSNKGGSNGWKLFTYFYIMLTVLSVVLGNDPVILSGTVFLAYYTQVNELEPMAWLISEFAAANTASMVLFVGNPTNVVICEGFNINNAAFTAYTIFPFLACSITCFFALTAQFHRSKYLPHRIDVTGDLDVRAVLLDPKGAMVGSLLLGSCLTIVIVVSFLHVDVWMITLPFAGAKFIFDIAWDHYRYVHNSSSLYTAEKSDEDLAGIGAGIVLRQLRQHRTIPIVESDRLEAEVTSKIRSETTAISSPSSIQVVNNHPTTIQEKDQPVLSDSPQQSQANLAPPLSFPAKFKLRVQKFKRICSKRFPTLYTAFPRLPFALVPFAFSQFILIEALAHQGWIHVFGRWLVAASGRRVYPTIWLVGGLGVILCNCSGTNIGATILITKVVREAIRSAPADMNLDAFNRSAAIALAVSSNIGAVSFTFSASLAGLLWIQILNQKEITITQRSFARWNFFPLIVMTSVGLAVVCAEMAVLF